jgi:hypothetical protein
MIFWRGMFNPKSLLLLLLMIIGNTGGIVANPSARNDTLDDKDIILTSFVAEKESIRSILTRISSDYDLNITFNASNSDFDKTVTYRAADVSPETLLTQVLALVGYEFTPIGNQLAVHRSEQFEEVNSGGTANMPGGVHFPDTIVRIVEVPVVVYDTVVIHQTRTETVYRSQPYATVVRPLVINRPSHGPLRIRNERFAVSFSYAQLLAGYNNTEAIPGGDELQNVRDADGASFRNFMLNGGLHYRLGAIMLSSSVALSGYSLPFNYTELFSSGGYHRIDTLDSFYTIVNGQEEWFHVTDSTYIPLETRELLYDRTNNLGMLDFKLGIAYDLFMSAHSSLFILAGVQAGIPVWQRGNTIVNESGYPAVPLDRNELNNVVYGFHAGPGVRTKLNDRLDVVFSAIYQRYLSELQASHPLNRQLRGIAIQMGVQYAF